MFYIVLSVKAGGTTRGVDNLFDLCHHVTEAYSQLEGSLCRFSLGIDWIKAKRIEGMWETGRTDFS